MESGICLHSVIPVRAEPSHKAEMVTQVLFGELYHVTEKDNLWVKIRLLWDGYEGWISILQVNPLDEEEFNRLSGAHTSITGDLVQLLSVENTGAIIPLLPGSSLPALEKMQTRISNSVYYYEGLVSEFQGEASNAILHTSKQKLIGDARLYMNTPYLWGGRSPFGIDCSGFVQMAYKLQGIKLLRDASQQAAQGEVISLLVEAEPGDLAFFDDAEGNIVHVGMLIDHQSIIHCSGYVRIDPIDHEGIYSANLQKYTHKLRLIKRII